MATLDRLRTKIASLIEDKGKTVTYKAVTSTYDRTTGATTDTEVSTSIKVTPPRKPNTRRIDGELVRAGDTLVSYADFEKKVSPKIGDKVSIDSVDWQIVEVTPIYTGELIGKWDLQLRK